MKTVPPTEVEGRPPSTRLRSLPPLDPTIAPSFARLPVRPSGVSGLQPIARPILASECLKDDIAPLEPFPRACRAVLAVSGVTAIGGAALLLASFPAVAVAVFAGGALTTVAAALPGYRLRGAVGAGGSLVVATALAAGEHSWAFRALAAIVLASALFTRASYRAHRGVRIALAVGIALYAAAALASAGSHAPSRLGAAAMAIAAVASLLGFMGEQTTGGTAWWAGVVLVAAGASIAALAPVALVPLAAVTILFAATVSASTSLFVVAAAAIAPSERARDHRSSIPAPPSNDNE